MYPYCPKLLLLYALTVIAALPGSVSGQEADRYIPRKTYGSDDREMMSSLRAQMLDEVSTITSKRKSQVLQVYSERTNYLIEGIREGAFIKDDSLQAVIDSVVKRLLRSNTLKHQPKQVLILKSSLPNASCYGEGTFIVSVGLLSRLDNESQLAFTMAHELAHYELEHMKTRILLEVETKFSKNVKSEITKILTDDDATLQRVDSARKLMYGLGRFSRRMEQEADSLGYLFFRNAGYRQTEIATLLSILDSAEFPKYRVDLFKPFHLAKYPFQDYWLKQRPRVFSKKVDNVFIFSNDSLSSHPDIAQRKARLAGFMDTVSDPKNFVESPSFQRAVRMAEFESVQAAFFSKQYDRALFLSLQLAGNHPHHNYLVSMIARILAITAEAKESRMFAALVPSYTGHYSEELRQVNNFLHNLTVDEAGELAFNFLNNQSNFDPSEEEHYLLLWKICGLTHRNQVQEKVKATYRAKFPKGKFLSMMK